MTLTAHVPTLKARKVVLAFTGWPDAGETVKKTFEELESLLPHELASVWDMESFWLSDQDRPWVVVRHGLIQQISWPAIRFYRPTDMPDSSLLLGIGPEPSCRWKTFTSKLLSQLRTWQCRDILLLGAFYDHVFHDETRISSVTHTPEGYNRATMWGCRPIDYEGPAGIHAVILDAAPRWNINAMSFWAHIPFYLNEPHEGLIKQLLVLVSRFTGHDWDLGYLDEKWRIHQETIEELLAEDPDLWKHIRNLKEKPPSSPQLVPRTGGSKVIKLDDFLKKRPDRSDDS